MDMSKLPQPLLEALLPFQKEGVQFAVGKNGRCLIADEMGLGKTLQAISVACMFREEWPLLVIVPSCVKFSWIEEFEKWLPDISPRDINLIQSGADASGIAHSPISIVTYGLLRIPSAKLLQETIRQRKFQVVICDESHYLKNAKTSSSKIIVPIIKLAKRRILLSGTPALARPVELYPQLDAVCPGQWGSFWKFTEQYCEPRYLHYGGKRQRRVDGASNLEELQQRMSGMLMIRREKSQVLTELPPKQRQRILFDLKDSSLKKEITKKFESLRQNIHKGSRTFQQLAASMESDADKEANGGNAPVSAPSPAPQEDSTAVFRDVSTLYRISGEAKIGPVREYIEMICENQDMKFLVFAYHHNMMDGVEQTLHAKKVRFVRIDGHTKPMDRQAYVSQFQSDSNIRVAILSILAAGVGLTLTAAKLVVFAELYWTPGVMTQCEDRAHRIGQTDPLSVHYLVARNTMDEWVWSSVCKKTVVTSAALTGQCRQLEHLEGEQYQIDVLSKAEAWVPQQNDGDNEPDVTKLIQSQRQPNQPSILDFLSPRQQSDPLNGKVYAGTKIDIGSHLRKHSRMRYASPATKIKAVNKNLDNSLIVIDSDEEEEFKPAKKKRKKVNTTSGQTKITLEEEKPNLGRDNDDFSMLQIDSNNGIKTADLSANSDDLFSVENSDTDSDSLPDVYLGQNWEKTKQENCKVNSEESNVNESCDKVDGKIQADLELCEIHDTEMLVNKELSSLSDVGDHVLNDSEQNNSSKLDRDQTYVNGSSSKVLKTTEGISVIKSDNSLLSQNDYLPSNCSPVKSVEAKVYKELEALRKLNDNVKNDNGHPTLSQTEDLVLHQSESKMEISSCSFPANSTVTPHKEKLKGEETTPWPCSICTFLNHQYLGQCEICDTPKKMASRNRNKVSTAAEQVDSSFTKLQSPSNQHQHSQESVAGVNSTSNVKDCDITLSETCLLTSPKSKATISNVEASNSHSSSVDGLSSVNDDQKRQDSVTIEKESETDSEISEDEDIYDDGNSNCGSVEHSQSEEDIENYEIESVKSDEEIDLRKVENKGVLKVHDIKNCDDGEESCSSNRLSDRDVEANKKDENRDVYVILEKSPTNCNTQGSNEELSNINTSHVSRASDRNCRMIRTTNVSDQTKHGMVDEEFPCDDLSNEDFDQVENFLSINGHLIDSKVQSWHLSENQNANHSSKSVLSTCAITNCVTSSLSSSLQLPSSSLAQSTSSAPSSIPPTTTAAMTVTTAPSPRKYPSLHQSFQYSCSLHTGRIYVYDKRGESLKVNFQPVDIEMGNTDKLPDFLQLPQHYRLLQRFVREWMSLSATKRRVIAKQSVLFERPLQAYESVKSVHGSTQRHLVKESLAAASEKAEMIQGHVRLIQRPNQDGVMVTIDAGREGEGTAQVVTSDGIPLCLQCHKPYSNPLLPKQVITRPQNAWQLRLCSRPCMDKYWTLKHASYLREQIFEVERGICRLCHFDAQAFYNRMKCTKDVRQRAEIVNQSPYSKLGHKARERLVTHIMPGHFWHVDHIVPVWRGGGMCDLDNLRTLCTPCHAKVTKDQAGQRATIKKLSSAVSSGDITAFFKKS